MKTKGIIALFLIMAATGLHGISLAQEGGFSMPDSEESNAVENTRGENLRSGYTIDPASKKAAQNTSSNESAVNKKRLDEEDFEKSVEPKSSAKKQPANQPAPAAENTPKKTEETEDSVLSFNILYYMIQKFKFSDVIDQ